MDEKKQPEFARRLIAAVEAVPGVRSAAMVQQQIVNYGNYSSSIKVSGYEAAPDEDMDARMYFVTPGYFETVGTPLLTGRTFGPEDVEGSTPAVIVDQVLADKYFAGGDPLAQTIEYDTDIGMIPSCRTGRERRSSTTYAKIRVPRSMFPRMPIRGI